MENIHSINLHTVVFGGGVTGLWTLNMLEALGYNAALVETQSMGLNQTIACQGILHGGVKYSLAGKLTKSAINIKEMPQVWKTHMKGDCSPDLSKLEIRSDFCYLWGKSLWLLGSLLGLSVRPFKIPQQAYPEVLTGYKGDVYTLPEQIISPKSLLEVLSGKVRDRLIKTSMDHIDFTTSVTKEVTEIRIHDDVNNKTLLMKPSYVVLAAGAGNGDIRHKIGFDQKKQQIRPLRMLMLKGFNLPRFNGHYIEGSLPTVTVTSALDAEGKTVWMLGGKLAENGVNWSSEKLKREAEKLLQRVFPGRNFSGILGADFSVDRAEADTNHCKKPDDVYVEQEENVITTWPTKMVLAPRVADRIARIVSKSPSDRGTQHNQAIMDWQKPVVAEEPWETVEQWYTVN